MNILSIDPGKRYIGLAIANNQIKIAMPYQVLEVKDQISLYKMLREIIAKEKIQKVVVGFPVGMSGKPTEQTNITEQFIKDLKKKFNIPIIKFDERLSSKMADKLSFRGLPSQGERTSVHAVAASIILQNFLDSEKI